MQYSRSATSRAGCVAILGAKRHSPRTRSCRIQFTRILAIQVTIYSLLFFRGKKNSNFFCFRFGSLPTGDDCIPDDTGDESTDDTDENELRNEAAAMILDDPYDELSR